MSRCGFMPFLALLATAAAATAGAQEIDLDAYPAVAVDELPAATREWLERDVRWLITDGERDVLLRLRTDAQRSAFVDGFWASRDPSPGTAANEFREEHYARLAHAEANFGRESPTPGWRTDRGRAYVLLGAPQTVNRLPNTSRAVPVEVWFYNVDPALGLPPFFYLIFFKDRGVGEYRLYSPAMDGPEALLNSSGREDARRGGDFAGGGALLGGGARGRALDALQRVDAELGNAAASLIPGDGGALAVSPLRSEMVLGRLLDLPRRLMPNPLWAFRLLTGAAEAEVRFETLPMSATAVVLIDPGGLPFVHFATQTVGERLNLNRFGERYYVTFDVTAVLRDADQRALSDAGPRTLQADIDAETAARLRRGPVRFIERMPVVAGPVSLEVVLENNVTREFARQEFALDVPDLSGVRLEAGLPVLVQDLAESSYDPFAEQFPFQVGGRFLVPAVEGPFAESSSLWVLRQVVFPAARTDAALLVHTIRDARGDVVIEQGHRLTRFDRNAVGVIDSLAEIDLAGLPVGQYVLESTLEAVPRLRATTRFSVQPIAEHVRAFVHALPQPPAGGAVTRVERAAQLRTRGHTAAAIDELDRALSSDPRNEAALDLQLDLLDDAGRYEELEALLAARLARQPNRADWLVLLGEAMAKQGEHYDAIRYYERARLAGRAADPAVLNALAAEYFAEGDLRRARELLAESLQLEPQHPEALRLLEAIERSLQ